MNNQILVQAITSGSLSQFLKSSFVPYILEDQRNCQLIINSLKQKTQIRTLFSVLHLQQRENYFDNYRSELQEIVKQNWSKIQISDYKTIIKTFRGKPDYEIYDLIQIELIKNFNKISLEILLDCMRSIPMPELEFLIKDRIIKENLQLYDFFNAVFIYLKSSIRPKQSVLVPLLAKLNLSKIEKIRPSQNYILILFCLLKCRRLKIQVPQEYFDVLCQKVIKSLGVQNDPKALQLLGNALAEAGIKQEEVFAQIQQQAQGLYNAKITASYLEYLKQTVLDRIEVL